MTPSLSGLALESLSCEMSFTMDNRVLNALFRMDCIIVEGYDKIDSTSMEYLSRTLDWILARA